MYKNPLLQPMAETTTTPRHGQDDLRQEQIAINISISKFFPVVEEVKETDKLSRTSSVASLPESFNNYTSAENFEIQINALIKPLKDEIIALTEQSNKLTEENLNFHKLLAEQSRLIERLIKNNQILELRLVEQKNEFNQQLAQERQERETAAKSMEAFKSQIFSKLKQHEEGLHAELTEQTSKSNINRETLQQDFNSFNVEMTEKEQQHHQKMLIMFKQLEEPLKEQEKKHNDLQKNFDQVRHNLHNHWHHYHGDCNYTTHPTFGPEPKCSIM